MLSFMYKSGLVGCLIINEWMKDKIILFVFIEDLCIWCIIFVEYFGRNGICCCLVKYENYMVLLCECLVI